MIELRDGIEGLRSLPEGSVGLVLTDLPSGETEAEFDCPPNLMLFWPAVWRALRLNGAVVLMCSSMRFSGRVIESQSKFFRYDLVWHKSLATGHLNARHRPLRAHEYLLVFSRKKNVFHPEMRQGGSPIHFARRTSHGENYRGMSEGERVSRAGATDRFPTSVLEFASVGTSSKVRRHPQQKPVELLRWCIRSYSEPGDLVVDPYAGSGSCEEAALTEGRKFRGWDSSPRFGQIPKEEASA